MLLPINLSIPQMQVRWKSILDPLLSAPLSNVSMLQDVVLTTGVNTIYHKLGRIPVGWFMTDANTAITLYRSAPFNAEKLVLTASSGGTISLVVF